MLTRLLLLLVVVTALQTGVGQCYNSDEDLVYDKALLARRLNITVEHCSDTKDQACALKWINKFGRLGDYFTNILNRFTYSYANKINKTVGDEMLQLSDKVQTWGLRHAALARRFDWRGFSDPALRRRFMVLSFDITLDDANERRELAQLQQGLMVSYSRTAACPDGPDHPSGCLPAGEQAVMDVVGDPGLDYDAKVAVWRSWHDAASAGLGANFTRYAQLANKAARARGFADAGESDWRVDFETETFNSDVLAWHSQLLDLYTQLHAYVRHRLSLRYPGRFDPSGCLPVHILGHDQWGQQWRLPLSDFPYPDRAKETINYTDLLQRKFGNFSELVRASEEFYTSLGMPAMTREFWAGSDFLKPADPKTVKDCHASAWEFASRLDFRIKMCGRVGQEDFYVIHHEMGHVEYFMAYSGLPREFRGGANSGFHEAVGDTMALSVDTRKHFATLGLVDSGTESKEDELNSMFAKALDKVPFLPFALTAGVFRWLLFNGTAGPDQYNPVWWRLRAEYGGVCPPVDRPEVGFDPLAKYHLALDISYIRYYFSYILQFQLHRRMCQLSGHTGPINRCDFYRSKSAGQQFMKMLQAGASHPWNETLKEFTGQDGLQTSAIIDYFKPLRDWLAEYNKRNGVPVGWKVPDNVLKGVTR